MVKELTREEQDLGRGLDPLVSAEIDNFEKESTAFLNDGGGLGDDFRPFRLQHGIYGQRQDDAQMIRIKIPHGSMTAEQLDVVGDIADRYTPRKVGHVTTRQAIQLHYVKLADTATVLRKLAEVGLTTREACGNTVRNVTADEMSGLCPDTVFDITPYAEAAARFFLRHPVCQKLPRKFKIAFSACPHDHGLVPIHDLGATAVMRDGNRGFRVTVGGGLGASPHIAQVLDEFVPEDDLLRVSEATIRVFDRLGERKNRNKARIKFVVKKLGMDEFRRVVQEELATLPPAESGQYLEPDWSFLEEDAAHPSAASLGQNGHAPQPGFDAWKRTNAISQAQAGFSMVYVLLPIGDLTVEQFHALATIARKYAGGKIRTAVNQNMVLRWVHDEDLVGVHAELVEAGLAEDGVLTLSDVMTCPGTDTCSLGVTSSKGLGRAIRDILSIKNGHLKSDPLVEQVRIKISGCPNSCGHHHIADIGFYGNAVRSGERMVPSFSMLIAGKGEGPDARIATHVMKIAAKRIPDAVVTLLEHYQGDRSEGEPFGDWALRVGKDHIKDALAEYSKMPVFEEDPMAFVDWEANKLFSLEDMGEGECAV
ncbi:MAG: nitrite/sulfite reductase [Chloroflexi bacterium]|nr:nitrite/sulfite reductase [Chloroflexota bacterium]